MIFIPASQFLSFLHYTNRLHVGLSVRVKMALCLEAPLSSNADDRSCLLRLLSPMSASIPSVPAALMTFFLYLLFFFFLREGKVETEVQSKACISVSVCYLAARAN